MDTGRARSICRWPWPRRRSGSKGTWRACSSWLRWARGSTRAISSDSRTTVATTCSSERMFPGTHAASAPDRPAVIMAESGRTLTYKELDDNSARLASALHAMGLRQGDVIAMLSDNSAEAFEVYWAALRSGLYITAVNWHLAAEEAAYILRDSGARVVIASAGVRAVAEPLVSLVPEVAHWYAFGGNVAGYRS